MYVADENATKYIEFKVFCKCCRSYIIQIFEGNKLYDKSQLFGLILAQRIVVRVRFTNSISCFKKIFCFANKLCMIYHITKLRLLPCILD
uniref:SJCHGC09727 protein n=1 Tax=Schistosoma japonicum TaxID=6182 RepID=Q5BR15_SCHJA|nr:SJCHGC09727 protein [Schistosoma japonicum]